MRALIVASLVIIPLLLFYGLSAVTGDSLSGVVFGLIVLITVAAWFGGHPVAPSPKANWKSS